MDSESYDNIFAHAQARRPGFIEVPMDTTEIVILSEGQQGAIATRRLGGCSGIVILGRTAAIKAHVAPRPPTAAQSASASRQHFVTILRETELLYTTNRQHFPAEATAWGFYVAGFPLITDQLKAIAIARLANLGLSNQHTYYNVYERSNRRDEVRACVRLFGQGNTSFYIEQRLVDNITFPEPLPERQAAQIQGRPEQRNFLAWWDRPDKMVQMAYGRRIEPDWERLSGVYDIYRVNTSGGGSWLSFDFDTNTWV